MVTRTTALTITAFGIITMSPLTPAFAQDAKAIVAKSIASYGTPKTYQADMIMDTTGPQGKSKMTISIKKSGEKLASKISSTTATPMGKNFTTVMDGKMMYLYMADMNQYMKMPLDPMVKQMTKQGGSPDEIMKMISKEGTFKKLADSSVDGKPVFVLEAIDTKKPNSGKSKLYLDKKTSRLVKMEGSAPNIGVMGGGGGMVLLVRNEKINAPLPASAFVFTPPKGAKVMQNPMGGGAPRRP